MGKNPLEEIEKPFIVNKESEMQYLGAVSKTTEWSLFNSHSKSFNTTVMQAYTPTTNAKEAKVEWFYEDLQDLLELIPKKVVLFITGD